MPVDEIHKIYIYGQQCLMAGSEVPECEVDDLDDEVDDPDDNDICSDWDIYEGTKAELLAEARAMFAGRWPAGTDRYKVSTARSIAERFFVDLDEEENNMETYKVIRTGEMPLEFEGRLLASASG